MAPTTAPSLALVRRLLASGEARRVREAAGLSRADIARDLGVDESTVQRWEAGARSPRAEVGLKYGEMLGELLQIVGAR